MKKRKRLTTKQLAERRKKSLTKKATLGEKSIAAKLEGMNVIFEFQKIIYTERSFFIPDFFIAEVSTVLEVDGGYHKTIKQINKDKRRTTLLKLNGVTHVKRLTNEQALAITPKQLLAYLGLT